MEKIEKNSFYNKCPQPFRGLEAKIPHFDRQESTSTEKGRENSNSISNLKMDLHFSTLIIQTCAMQQV